MRCLERLSELDTEVQDFVHLKRLCRNTLPQRLASQ
jgi:hypothetical protein